MNEQELKSILTKIRQGTIDVETAFDKMKNLPFEDIQFAKIDHHRGIRNGFPEVIFCQGKTDEQILAIVKKMLDYGSNVFATRASETTLNLISKKYSDALINESARVFFIKQKPVQKKNSKILVISAGTSDIPVAEEARLTAEVLGNNVDCIYDIGVAGIHRLFRHLELIRKSNVLIVVAGMEGALASVVGGLVEKPVIAVPTSVGYGASFGGVAALLSMLNSCAAGVGVVNIDNGFGAGVLANSIAGVREEE